MHPSKWLNEEHKDISDEQQSTLQELPPKRICCTFPSIYPIESEVQYIVPQFVFDNSDTELHRQTLCTVHKPTWVLPGNEQNNFDTKQWIFLWFLLCDPSKVLSRTYAVTNWICNVKFPLEDLIRKFILAPFLLLIFLGLWWFLQQLVQLNHPGTHLLLIWRLRITGLTSNKF